MASAGTSGKVRQLRVLAVAGGPSADALNRSLLEAAARAAAPEAEFQLGPPVDTIPCFHPDAEPNQAVRELRGSIEEADALLVATPEYNGSIPGGLKNAIDWAAAPARRGPLRGKPVAVIGADRADVGCDWAQADLRKVLEVAGARVVSEGLSIGGADEAFAPSERLEDPEAARQLDFVLEELISESRCPG